MRTIFQQIDIHSAFAPIRPAVVLPDRFITYEMLRDGVASVQRVVSTLALDRDQLVGVLVDNPVRHLIVVLALLKSGYSVCPMRADEREFALSCGARTIISDTRLPLVPDVRAFFVDEKWFLDRQDASGLDAPLSPARLARTMFTSGSTGRPKAVGWSIRTLHQRIQNLYAAGIATSPRFITSLGLSGAGLANVLAVLFRGGTVYFAPASDVLKMISDYTVDELRASTSQIHHLMEQAARERYAIRIPLVTPGGAQNTPDFIDRIRHTFGSRVIDTYTSTESGHMALAADEVLNLRRARGNCFVPVADIEIVDDEGNRLPRGAEGRIRARTDAMAWPLTSNFDDADEPQADGWFYPGDVGRIDSDGLLVVTGRADEVINDGGVKYSPETMEDLLRRHPKVADAAVVRMSAPDRAQEAWLAVVARSEMTKEELSDWLQRNFDGELSSVTFARFFVLREIPRTAMGKVARNELRELMRTRTS